MFSVISPRCVLPNVKSKFNSNAALRKLILQHVELLLRNDREMGGYTRVVSGHRLGKHVPVARQ
jgi:hypothetical protein